MEVVEQLKSKGAGKGKRKGTLAEAAAKAKAKAKTAAVSLAQPTPEAGEARVVSAVGAAMRVIAPIACAEQIVKEEEEPAIDSEGFVRWADRRKERQLIRKQSASPSQYSIPTPKGGQ